MSVIGHSQDLIDSLKADLVADKNIESRLDLALKISKEYAKSDLDSALHYVGLAEILAPEVKNKNVIPKIRLQQAGILIMKQDFVNSEKLLRKNLKEAGLESKVRAMTNHNLGSIYFNRQEYKKAINVYIKALKIYEKEKDSLGIVKVNVNIGTINARIKNYSGAISYLEVAKLHAKNNKLIRLQVLANLAGTYHDQNNYEKAISTGEEAVAIAKKINSPVYLGLLYSNLCNSYMGNGQFNEAIEHGLAGVKIKQQLGQNTDALFNNLGYVYLQQGYYNKAISSLKAISSQANTSIKSLVYNNLASAYSKLNDHKTAWKYAQLHKNINDSINKIQLRERDSISGIVRTYEAEKNAQVIDLLNTKNELNQSKIRAQRNTLWAIGILALLLMMLGVVIYKNQKTKQQLKAAMIKHQLLRTQLNPHFLFHALHSIQSYLFLNKTKESVEYLGSFSKLMRLVLESSDRDFITVEKDAEVLKEYLKLQQLNQSYHFEYEVNIAANLNAEFVLIPPSFTQPIVENAILHGLKGVDQALVNVNYTKDSENLVITIRDNGKGMINEARDDNKMHRSMSNDINKERVENLKSTYNYACSIHTESSEAGTTIILKFPIRQEKL